MTKVISPLFGTTATGRIGDIGTFRTSATGAQLIKVQKAKKKKKKPKPPLPEQSTIKALDVAATTYPGMAVAIFPADRVTTTTPPIDIIAISDPANGTANLYSDKVVYQPNPGFTGTDAMTYTARDASDATDTAVIRIKLLKPKKLKKGPTPDPYAEWLKEQLSLARKQWIKLPRQKMLVPMGDMHWRTHYFREPEWPQFWRQWLVDHPFQG